MDTTEGCQREVVECCCIGRLCGLNGIIYEDFEVVGEVFGVDEVTWGQPSRATRVGVEFGGYLNHGEGLGMVFHNEILQFVFRELPNR